MAKTHFKPLHINATPDDLIGNNTIGRYVFLPGSDGRAKEMAAHFDNLTVKEHPRGHHLYLGTLSFEKNKVDVAVIATGMGCSNTEIILHELFYLGAKRFLRIGTAGSLQPDWVNVGDLINVQASVRDDGTSVHYAPLEVPAIASLEFVSSILLAHETMGFPNPLHTGIVHCKSALYAREFGSGPRASENNHYLNLLTANGILASEMETATLFIQSQIYNYQLMQQGATPFNRVLSGAILSVISSPAASAKEDSTVSMQNAVQLGFSAVKTLAAQELMS